MENSKVIGTVDVLIRKGDKVLLLHRGAYKRVMPGIAMGPGGKREFNEHVQPLSIVAEFETPTQLTKLEIEPT
ncbi:MAG TPA: hypothetical protein VEA59_01820 [Patescibacteria group bacterium]|nr:hypothetical protein [Patescibacteria group bacterium]